MSIIFRKGGLFSSISENEVLKSTKILLKPLNINSFKVVVLCLLSHLTNEF